MATLITHPEHSHLGNRAGGLLFCLLAACAADPADRDMASDGGSPGDKSGDDTTIKYHKSGDRLKMRVGVAADGSEMFAGWQDTMLDVECTFQNLNGTERCLPPHMGGTFDYLYSDSDCTIPLAGPLGCIGGWKWAAIGSDTCGEMEWEQVFEVTGIFEGQKYSNSGAGCDPYDLDVVALEAVPVPDEMFVTREIEIR